MRLLLLCFHYRSKGSSVPLEGDSPDYLCKVQWRAAQGSRTVTPVTGSYRHETFEARPLLPRDGDKI